MLTAGHIATEILRLYRAEEQYQEYNRQVTSINADSTATKNQKKKRIRELRAPNRNAITNYSAWWAVDGWTVTQFHINGLADIAIGKINGFDKSRVLEYPEFKNPNHNFDVGENLCKLGFPFHNIDPTYDETTNAFQLPAGAVPLPLFPIEGIYTRTIIMEDSGNLAEFVETSSPGLRGQSGGPIFDAGGRVWALQSHTVHLPLGFSPEVPNHNSREHQFLNAGVGTHSRSILEFLDRFQVSYRVSTD